VIDGTPFWFRASNTSIEQHQTAELTFVGSQTCSGCHQSEANLWKDSQHRHAMNHATDATVRGDFNDAAFEYAGMRSRFFRKDRMFLVETDGPDGRLATFEVKYTFLSNFPMAAFRRCQSHGTRARRTKAASAGFTSIPTVQSPTAIPCIGRS
jgi:hypothetical protein